MNQEQRFERLEQEVREIRRELAALKKRPTREQEFTESEICQQFSIDGAFIATETTVKRKGLEQVIIDRVMKSPDVQSAQYLGGARYKVVLYA